jgi:AcrR family transcriptional regulator
MVLPSVTPVKRKGYGERVTTVSDAVSERRAALLEAADRVVQRDGPDASMNAIAAEAGITKPILYRHFGDKGGLYRALAARHIDDLLARLRAALLTRGGLEARTRATVDAYLVSIEDNPQVYRFLVRRAAVEEPGVRGQVEGFVRRFGDELAVGIAHEPALGQVPAARAAVWAHGIAGMVQAAGDWWLDQPDVPRAVVVDELVTLLVGGFTTG